jgi:nitric oxide reductase NorD protein
MNGTSEIEQFYALFPEPALAKDLTTILEDYRINSRLQAEYPVLGAHIAEMNAYSVSKRPSLDELANDKQRAVELIAQRLIAGRTKEQVPEGIEETLEEAVSRSKTLSTPHADVHETARVAAELYFLIDDHFRESYQPLDPFSTPLDQSLVNQTIGNFGRTARKISEKLTSEENESPPNDDKNDNHASEDTVRELLRALFKEKGIKPLDVESGIDALEPNKVKDYLSDLETLIREEKGLQSERDTYLYPEWGNDIEDYRVNWTRIRERSLAGGSDEFYLDTIQKYAGLIKIIRREFQMLRPEGLVKLRGQCEGNDIDLDSAVHYFIDRRLRRSPSERNYVRTEKRTRDIAVAFLVDMSGSTAGATIRCEKEALILMSEALNELGDAFAIFGFSGYGRDNVVFYTAKDFDDPYDQRVQSKLSTMMNEQSTRIAPAIRHATTKLRRKEEKIKMLILLSDGKPLDQDYYGTYAIEDTSMALREAQRYGIKSFCITVDRQAAEYLPRMYASSRWVVIDDVVKLPDKITRIYKRFTT